MIGSGRSGRFTALLVFIWTLKIQKAAQIGPLWLEYSGFELECRREVYFARDACLIRRYTAFEEVGQLLDILQFHEGEGIL